MAEMFFHQGCERGGLVNMANLGRYPEAIIRTGVREGERGTAADFTSRLEGIQGTQGSEWYFGA